MSRSSVQRFKTPAGQFRGKPFATEYNEYGLPFVVVCPTDLDKRWVFSDTPASGEAEMLDMMQHPADLREPEQRLRDALATSENGWGTNYDSCEIGVQCFDDGRWPARTDLRCWWDCHPFATRPFPCPMRKRWDGVWVVHGVFCGPSCAKAWAAQRCTARSHEIFSLIDSLARRRGFLDPKDLMNRAAVAPPRETLQIFRGHDGMTIEQFRGMCAAGFDCHILDPPYITHKQVLVAEYERLVQQAKTGVVHHRDTLETLATSPLELAQKKREGLTIFAGVGSKKLSDYFVAPSTKKTHTKKTRPS
jgi:hypothetical protein